MTPRKIILWTLAIAVCLSVLVLGVLPTKRWAGPPGLDGSVPTIKRPTSGDCSPIITDAGDVEIFCSPPDILYCGPDGLCSGTPIGQGPIGELCNEFPGLCNANGEELDKPHQPLPHCIRLGVSGPCLDRSIFSGLERAEYAFNAPQEMAVSEPQTIALVIDTTGQTDFSAELMTLPGVQVEGETPISLVMEAEIVGPAFQITPSGRQRRELSELNPTRWDWEVTPTRGGQHQLEVSLYVLASEGGESIGEEKALAERRIITVTVSPLNRVTAFIAKVDPILAFFVAIGGAIAAVLAWFGIKSWRDVSGKEEAEDKPQKIEVTIKDASKDDKG